jgi:hypothetical protein
MTQQTKTVTIGEDERKIRPFKGLKGVYAGAILAGVTDEAQAIMDADQAYQRDYTAANKRRIPEELAIVREWQIPERAWRTDEATGERYILMPAYPSDEQRYLHGFNAAFKLARDQVLQLMALVLIDDDRLYDTEDQGGEGAVRELLLVEGRKLFRQATLGELIDLAYAAFEVVRDEMASRSGKLQAVTDLFGLTRSRPQTQPDAEPSENEQTTSSIPPTSESTQPDSSTDSPTPTDGDDETSSSPVGANSSA